MHTLKLGRTSAFATFALFIAAGGVVAQEKQSSKANRNPGDEPPQNFKLTIDEKTIPIELGTTAEIEIGGRKYSCVLNAERFRVLRVDGIELRYPASHGFEFEEVAGAMRTWTLDGNDNTLMLHCMPAGEPTEVASSVAKSLVARFGTVRQTKCSIKLGGADYSGERIDASIAGTSLRQEICGFKAAGRTYVLIVQDSLDGDGKVTRETRNVLKMLDESMKIQP